MRANMRKRRQVIEPFNSTRQEGQHIEGQKQSEEIMDSIEKRLEKQLDPFDDSSPGNDPDTMTQDSSNPGQIPHKRIRLLTSAESSGGFSAKCLPREPQPNLLNYISP